MCGKTILISLIQNFLRLLKATFEKQLLYYEHKRYKKYENIKQKHLELKSENATGVHISVN